MGLSKFFKNVDFNAKIDRVVCWFAEDKDNNIVYTYHNDKENKDVYGSFT